MARTRGSKRNNLRRTITRELRRSINHGEYQPGGKLPTLRQLGERFETSHANVAAAVNQLVEEGLLSKRQGSGIFVRRPTDIDPYSLKMYTLYPLNPEIAVIMQEFRRRNPDLKIFDGFNFNQADISAFGTSGLFHPIRNRQLLPLNHFLDKSGISPDEFHPASLQPAMNNGKLYAIPVEFSPDLIFYNREVIRVPFSIINNWTLEDMTNYLRDNASRLAKQQILPYNYSRCFFSQVLPYLPMFGASVTDADGNYCTLSAPPALEAFEYVRNLFSLCPSPFNHKASPKRLILNGKTAIAKKQGPLNALIRKDATTAIGMAPMPTGRCNVRTFCGIWLSINRNCTHPEQAWRLLRFFARSDIQKTIAENHYLFPARLDAIEHLKTVSHSEFAPLVERLNSERFTIMPVGYEDLLYLDRILEGWHETSQLPQLLRECSNKMNVRLAGQYTDPIEEVSGL